MTALGALLGAALGALAVLAARRLPLGIPERLEQPAWTRAAAHPAALVAAGAGLGAAVGSAAAGWGELGLGLVLVGVLVPATAIDLAWRVVPDTLVVAGSAASLAVLALADPAALPAHLATGAVAGLVALLAAIAARGGLGLGDVKLIAMAGLALGPLLAAGLACALLLAGMVALPLLATRGRGATLPLVPFLAAGLLVVAIGRSADVAGLLRVTAIVT